MYWSFPRKSNSFFAEYPAESVRQSHVVVFLRTCRHGT